LTIYSVDIVMALEKGERVSRAWWARRLERATLRSGGLPSEIAEPLAANLWRETDPDTGERFARAELVLAEGTGLQRAREISHTLTSVLVSEGHTLRADGRREDLIPGEGEWAKEGEFGGTSYAEGRVCAGGCMTCIFASDSRWGCCGQGAAFSLADIGSILLAGDDELAAAVLAMPGEMDGIKWHPHLKGGICALHHPSQGCTLPKERMPLQCRTYLCAADRLLPADLHAQYEAYVDALEEAEAFVEDHMRLLSKVDFGSPLPELKAAAARAFAAWEAGAVFE